MPDSLDYAALDRTPVATDPFPHIVVPNFVPPSVLPSVIETLPEMSSGGSFPPSSLRLRGAARDLITAMESPRLRAHIAAKFGLDLNDSPTMLTVRGRTREKDGQIHTDSTAKLVTVLLYLNPASADWAGKDGCLRLLRGPNDLEDYAVEVPPVDGTLLVFPNGPTTFHGHRTFVGRRYAIQLNYMANDNKARYELRRHKVSAVMKRLLPA
ncbi:2OG-Fe(II) oxygenase [Acetobacteraceae bacterium KSS8]|uniref:2OG-Fe(II) oxygenase n=1 Tax=Endosaccharibacter trunci TaxID=2812733 RepID=A0ABT1W8W4_9PROT|nr:2OG-Fe(II) oxygenase [Acetobacteraceae bacterium KSS8]